MGLKASKQQKQSRREAVLREQERLRQKQLEIDRLNAEQEAERLRLQREEEERRRLEEERRRKRAIKRKAAVNELVKTEETYVALLELCILEYYNMLLNFDSKILSQEDHKTIFCDVKVIHNLNKTFLKDLHNTIEQHDHNKIGKQFVQFCPYFRMYQNYMQNYDSAMKLMPRLKTKPSFVLLCNEIRDRNKNITLDSLLILPIQRLPRYKMCLQEIIHNTEPEHPDLTELQRALQLVMETTTLLNDRMKDFDSQQLVRELNVRFTPELNLVSPWRRFIYEGAMTKVNKAGRDQLYTFFLLNDLLFYASGGELPSSSEIDGLKTAGFKLHTNLPIDNSFHVTDIESHVKYSDRAFAIHSSVKSFIVHCSTQRDKKKWMEQLGKAVEEQRRRHSIVVHEELAAPLMVPDDWSEYCMVKQCGSKFTFMNRRHHCRYCGQLICSRCGKYTLAAKTDKTKFVKPVCVECYNMYSEIKPVMDGATALERDRVSSIVKITTEERKDEEDGDEEKEQVGHGEVHLVEQDEEQEDQQGIEVEDEEKETKIDGQQEEKPKSKHKPNLSTRLALKFFKKEQDT